MNVSIIGLDLSHPFQFAQMLQKRGIGIHSLVTAETASSRRFLESFPCPRLTTIDDLASAESLPDGIIVASITSERLGLAPLLQMGIPTYFCKQIAADLDAVRVLLSCAEAGGAPILGNSCRRYAPAFAGITRMAHGGDLGRIVIAHRYEPHDISPGSWQDRKETSGGFIVNFGVHCIDSLCALLGHEYHSVHCVGGRYLHESAESEDSCVITIQFRNGSIGIAEVFGSQEPFRATQPSLRVHGSRNSVEAYIDEGLIRSYRGAPLYDAPTYSFCDGMEGTVDAFCRMMQDRLQPVPFAELHAIAEILALARRSFEEQRTTFADEISAPQESTALLNT